MNRTNDAGRLPGELDPYSDVIMSALTLARVAGADALQGERDRWVMLTVRRNLHLNFDCRPRGIECRVTQTRLRTTPPGLDPPAIKRQTETVAVGFLPHDGPAWRAAVGLLEMAPERRAWVDTRGD